MTDIKFRVPKCLLAKFIEWNEHRIESHDFCMEFERIFRDEIRQMIANKLTLRKKIRREMVKG